MWRNMLDEATFFYTNPKEYSYDDGSLENKQFRRVNGTDAYEKNRGDRVSYRTKNGRTASLTFTYKF
jgi:hypothetical protein